MINCYGTLASSLVLSQPNSDKENSGKKFKNSQLRQITTTRKLAFEKKKNLDE